MLFADGEANIIFMVDKYSLADTLHSESQTCRHPNSLHTGLGNGAVSQKKVWILVEIHVLGLCLSGSGIGRRRSFESFHVVEAVSYLPKTIFSFILDVWWCSKKHYFPAIILTKVMWGRVIYSLLHYLLKRKSCATNIPHFPPCQPETTVTRASWKPHVARCYLEWILS